MKYFGIIDTHAHYDDERFSSNLSATLMRQAEQGVTGIINAGSDLSSSRLSIELAAEFSFVWAAVGVHPHEAGNLPDSWLHELELLASQPKVAAIGEIGLDYYYPTPDRESQKKAFIAQLELANRLSMPVQIHDRDAHGDIFELVRQYRPSGCLHRYSGSPELAREYVKLGLYLGIGGALTYKNAKKERATVEAIPLESLLLETDCPYLAPEQFRGKTSTSEMLWVVAELIAAIKDVTAQYVVDITADNAKRAFHLT